MATTYESLRVFISSPGDMGKERKLAQHTIQRINDVCFDTLGLTLRPVRWEDFLPKTPKLPNQRIQDVLDAEIPKCQIFILLLGKRYGSKEPGRRRSNTQREVDVALKILERDKKIMFLSYFKKLPSSQDKGPQRRNVEKFRESIEKKGIFYREYSDIHEFKDKISDDLYRTVLRYCLSKNKHQLLQKFWVLGVPDRPTNPLLAIIYPSMGRTFMGPSTDKSVWLNRLEPNVVFEDFKALQKLAKTLRLISFRNFKIFNTENVPNDLGFMNRFWICLPRNTRGFDQASHYQKVSRFVMVRKNNRPSSYLKWRKTLKSKKYIEIRSPLAKYLRLQRSQMDISGEWCRYMENVIAKDYAILARYKNESSEIAMTQGYQQDYFLAGLRGLGTWGAAWFIDRKYPVFEKIDENENFDFLLEVEYRNGRIYDVRDVSDKPQTYFDDELNIVTIKKHIKIFAKK